MPQVDGDLHNRYAFYRDFLVEKITDEDVRFGHKIFRLPNPAKWKWLYRLDSWLSPKSRIIISFMLILTSILGLLADFFIDIKFLQDLSTETLMDIKFIHINPGAVKEWFQVHYRGCKSISNESKFEYLKKGCY